MPKFSKEMQPKSITIVGVERIYHGECPLLPGESEYVEVIGTNQIFEVPECSFLETNRDLSRDPVS